MNERGWTQQMKNLEAHVRAKAYLDAVAAHWDDALARLRAHVER